MGSPRPVPSLPDELLEEIFVRIGSPADLTRASTACVAFRRLIADPSFLRRYRSLHPPLLLGLIFLDGRGFQPAEAPHPSAALGRAVARAADFSFRDYFLGVTGARWRTWDVRNGRVLLRCLPEDTNDESFFPDLAVCDPLARRCLLLPPIPDDLLVPVQVNELHIDDSEAFLVPSGYEGDGTSFRVLARMDCTERVVTFIFSSASGHWSAGTSVTWDALGIQLDLEEDSAMVSSRYVHGCFYWKISTQEKWLKLDMSSMEIYVVDLPIRHDVSSIIIVEAGEGRIGMFGLIYGCNSLFYTTRQIGFERSNQLEMDNVIPLPVGFTNYIHGPYEGHIFIYGYRSRDKGGNMCFMLEIKTLKLSRVCRMRFGFAYPYFGFPPSMSQRRI